MSNHPEPLDLDAIEARAQAAIDDAANKAALDLSAAIDRFDATAVDDMLLLIAEVRRLRVENAALEKYAAELLNDRNLLLLELRRNACPTCGSSLSGSNIHFYSPSPTAEG